MAWTFFGEVVRFDPDTGLVVSLPYEASVGNDDPFLDSGEDGTGWTFAGGALSGALQIERVSFDFVRLDGTVGSGLGLRFGGPDGVWLIPDAGTGPMMAVAGVTVTGDPFPFPLAQSGLLPELGQVLQVQALRSGPPTGGGAPLLSLETLVLHDDDARIELAGQSAEAGALPLLHSADGWVALDVSVSDDGAGDTHMVEVRVQFLATDGLIRSFRALRLSDGATTWYVPRSGTVDLSTVDTILSETLQAGTLDGRAWAAFGLGANLTVHATGSEADLVVGLGGNDSADGNGGADTLSGSGGDDVMLGGGDDDWLFGGSHADTIEGGNGNDLVMTGSGDDVAAGDKGDDTVEGGSGDDSLTGGDNDDVLYGNDGDDTLDGGDGEDEAYASAGDDSVSGGAARDVLDGGDGRDTLDGGEGGDDLTGGSGGDILLGGSGGDTLSGEGSGDTLDGGDGQDELYGGNRADVIYGGADADMLDGGSGNDVMQGGDGDDTLLAADGRDTLEGGLGADLFVMLADGDRVRVADFEDGVDLLDLGIAFEDLVLSDLGGGEVQIDYAGDRAVIADLLGLLTVADLTAEDFA